MKRRFLNQWLLALAASFVAADGCARVHAADEAPDALIDRLTKEALDTIQADKAVQAGDVARIIDWWTKKSCPT